MKKIIEYLQSWSFMDWTFADGSSTQIGSRFLVVLASMLLSIDFLTFKSHDLRFHFFNFTLPLAAVIFFFYQAPSFIKDVWKSTERRDP